MQRRVSRQRSMILEELRKVKTHPTAETLYRMVRKRIPAVSFGTIYRNLRLLQEEGSIVELGFGKKPSRYDATVQDHSHLVCLSCGRVLDIEEPHCGEFAKLARRKFKFSVAYQRVDLYGRCHACAAPKKGEGHG
jgi:Fe2+ or Zn2+ uptake regulation protein